MESWIITYRLLKKCRVTVDICSVMSLNANMHSPGVKCYQHSNSKWLISARISKMPTLLLVGKYQCELWGTCLCTHWWWASSCSGSRWTIKLKLKMDGLSNKAVDISALCVRSLVGKKWVLNLHSSFFITLSYIIIIIWIIVIWHGSCLTIK